ncbi:MAG: hypothetical protein AcusKO_26210 [Acuticoccus sp.]
MRLVVTFALDEPWSVVSRLVAYASYARELGIEVVIKTLTPRGVDRTIDLAAFSPTLHAPLVDLSGLEPGPDDVVLFSAPKVHHTVTAQYGRRRPRFIHLLQSGLAASAVGDVGYGYRLFQKPMTRVVISARIGETILRLLDNSSDMTLIDAAIDLAPFERGPVDNDPFAVAINAFDGEFCGRVLDTARQRGFDERVRVIAADTPLKARAAAYRASTVLLASPGYGEGLSQPIHEAMAAGALVIMTNCEALRTLPGGAEPVAVVRQGDTEAMVRALANLVDMSPAQLGALRRATQASATAVRRTDERHRARQMFETVFQLQGVA